MDLLSTMALLVLGWLLVVTAFIYLLERSLRSAQSTEDETPPCDSPQHDSQERPGNDDTKF